MIKYRRKPKQILMPGSIELWEE